MDFLDDPFSEPKAAKAPVAGRFQPKAKLRPKKVPAVAVKETKEPTATSAPQDLGLNQSAQQIILVENKSDAPEIAFLGNSLEDGNLLAKAKEVAGSAVVDHSEIAVSGPSITTYGRNAEMENPNAAVQSEEEHPVFPNVSFASASPFRPCNSQFAPDQSVDKEVSECYEEPVVCGDGDFHIDVEQLGAGDFSCLDDMEIVNGGASEKRAVKLLPKPKAQGDRQKDSAEAVSHLPHVLELPSEDQHVEVDGSLHAGEPGTVSDVLHISLDDSFSLNPSLYQPDSVVSGNTDSLLHEDLPQQSGENHGERSCDALDSPVKSVDEGFLAGVEGNENGHKLDGMNDTFHDNSSSFSKEHDKFDSNRVENIDGEHLGEQISQKKKPRKSKKATSGNDKPTRKRKKAAQKPDEPTEKPPKKFAHATRRKRCVDKSLLEVPEDELDLQRVPIRDLLLLADYKERIAKKEAATGLPPPTSERFDNMSEEVPYDDNGTFGFDQYENACGNPSTSGIQNDTGYFNYQTFMTKEPRARWTKQDTELFYTGISQFGSDLSMIQLLFPGRTRHQMKLKYKKEERQNPMRIHDALTSRSKDHSHFELVIERLKEQAAQDAKTEKDDSVCPTGDDEGPEEVLRSHEDVAESKKKEGQVVDQEPDRPTVESPPKSHISEEEVEFDWNDYTSEL